MERRSRRGLGPKWVVLFLLVAGCASRRPYHNREMDFGSIKTVAVLPFWNMSHEMVAADRVRDVFATALLSTGTVYVIPPGEVARAVSRVGIGTPTTPSSDEIMKLGGLLKADAIITGVVKEYGEVRGASATANVVSLSVQMHETTTAKVIWSGASTRGGVGWAERLLGSTGGEPVNDVTEQAVDDLLAQLFQ